MKSNMQLNNNGNHHCDKYAIEFSFGAIEYWVDLLENLLLFYVFTFPNLVE